jgi:4-nitrophenyl phosphatase
MRDDQMLQAVRAVVLDMDGVLWRGSTPLPGLCELFAFFEQAGIAPALATNNSTNTVDTYVDKLDGMGVSVTPDQIVTSAVATAEYLAAIYGPDLRVHLVGEAGLHEIMLAAGYANVMADADVVVAGMDRDVTYQKLTRATLLINQGARFIGTNGDLTFPMPGGEFWPGAGSILASLSASTGQQPLIIGKPEPTMFEMVLQRLGVTADQTLMVGDRLETDILGAQRAGLKTALVWTGVTSPEILAASNIQPDMIFDDIVALRQALQAVQPG